MFGESLVGFDDSFLRVVNIWDAACHPAVEFCEYRPSGLFNSFAIWCM
jgi:hypothetical protein